MFFRYNFFGIFWGIIIFILSIVPGNDLPETEIVDLDFFCHVLFYLIFVLFGVVGFLKQYEYRLFRYNAKSVAFLFCMFYGIMIELIQHFFCEGRFFDMKDILANFIGAIFGILTFSIIYRKHLFN